jgi:hypothetical protein
MIWRKKRSDALSVRSMSYRGYYQRLREGRAPAPTHRIGSSLKMGYTVAERDAIVAAEKAARKQKGVKR